jgi:hypothetical protein
MSLPFRAAVTILFPLALAFLWVPAAPAADDPALSPAQRSLFERDHLAAIARPETLVYTFRQDGVDGFEDTVTLAIETVRPDGAKDLQVSFLTGERHMAFPPLPGFHGNPLIMYFLEWDVTRMHAATGGSTLYFRNRIREALVDRATVSATTITDKAGRILPAEEITLQPYQQDPRIDRYPAFRDKTYRVVLADAIPGTLYEIGTSLTTPDGKTVTVRTTFAEERP